ncbi:MAG: hypothetical protein ACKPKO_00075, partial [Candidatus Fonsibacter sp.]
MMHALQPFAEQAHECVGRMQAELTTLKKEAVRFEGEYELAMTALSEVVETLEGMAESVEALQRMCQESGRKISRLMVKEVDADGLPMLAEAEPDAAAVE